MSKYTDFIEKCAMEQGENTRFIVALTDEYIVDNLGRIKELLSEKEEKVLEIRVFNKEKEYKLFRPQAGDDFKERIRLDDGEFYDEVQYLDIDTKVSTPNAVYTTGGGKYNLPLQRINDAKIRIRYYLGKYDKTGQARICDWRIVELMEGK